MNWMYVLPNSYMEMMSLGDDIWRQSFGRHLGHESGALLGETCVLIKIPPRAPSPLLPRRSRARSQCL